MTVPKPQCFLREFFFSRDNKSACRTAVCKGKCFSIQILPQKLRDSPSALDKYTCLMDCTIEDEVEDTEDAENVLLCWIFDIFSWIFASLEPTSVNQRHTLEQFLYPQMYCYCIYSVDGAQRPLLQYDVPMESLPLGVTLDQYSPSSTWQTSQPKDIEIAGSGSDELLSGASSTFSSSTNATIGEQPNVK